MVNRLFCSFCTVLAAIYLSTVAGGPTARRLSEEMDIGGNDHTMFATRRAKAWSTQEVELL
jgi:hypothetical protein